MNEELATTLQEILAREDVQEKELALRHLVHEGVPALEIVETAKAMGAAGW